ncbi:MarR family winged helix-turn-helix transcriptional regulator [Thermovenabulum gondwanense]|uniref:Putative HTH-type transcriptional regulator YusO n=1 Tax=Thermovenabulum gondwanense TaxID=520767 RepID=A0A161PYR4_9FIRM|nr:MarR family transcriptional regulator [Thermovenabulum gondwanense]KYO67350.1 putative HTH-type transcriptional regulator YusO [Thermovenabulum gondwanense]
MECFEKNTLYGLFMKVIRLHYLKLYEYLEGLNIYPGQPPILFSLYKEDGQSQKDLAKRLNLKPATLTVMLGRIEKAGYIIRKQDDRDQRVQRVYLTDKGRKTCEILKEVISRIEGECFKDFSEHEKEILEDLLLKMSRNLENN